MRVSMSRGQRKRKGQSALSCRFLGNLAGEPGWGEYAWNTAWRFECQKAEQEKLRSSDLGTLEQVGIGWEWPPTYGITGIVDRVGSLSVG